MLVFAEKGWVGATFDGIARRVGLTRGAVHHHFRDKEALLDSVLREQWAASADVVLAPLRDTTRSPQQRLTCFVANYLNLLATDKTFRALATVTTLVAPSADSVSRGLDDKRQALDLWRDELRSVLADASVLRVGINTEHAVFVVMNFLIGATLTVATHPSGLPTGSAGSTVAAAVVDGLINRGQR